MAYVGFVCVGLKSLVNFFKVISLIIKIFKDSSIKFDILALNMKPNICFCSIWVLKIIIIIVFD